MQIKLEVEDRSKAKEQLECKKVRKKATEENSGVSGSLRLSYCYHSADCL